MTCVTFQTWGDEHCVLISGLYLLMFWSEGILKIFNQKISDYNQSLNHKGGSRTAPTRPGLLNSPKKVCMHLMQNDQAFLHMHSA